MTPVVEQAIVSLFCEDIRQEKSDVDTLIGIFPDNISVAQTPGIMPKCCLYVRGHFPVAHPPAKVEVRLTVPWEPHTVHVGQIEAPVIHAAVANAKEKEDRWIGLIFKAQFLNFPIPQPGRIFVIVSTGTKEFLTGTLRVVTGAPEQVSGPTSAKRAKSANKRRRMKPKTG